MSEEVVDNANGRERRLRDSKRVSWSFAGPDEAEDVGSQNQLVLQLIGVLGEKDAGRTAILKALVGKRGLSPEYDIERLLDGSSDRKLQVPAYVRGTLSDIGLATALAPLTILEVVRERSYC